MYGSRRGWKQMRRATDPQQAAARKHISVGSDAPEGRCAQTGTPLCCQQAAAVYHEQRRRET